MREWVVSLTLLYVPLLPLLPQIVDAVGDIPVLAAGGIGDGRGLAAVLMLGAQGALMGTRFIVADEAESAWPRLPEQVLAASGDDSVWTTAFDIAGGGGQSYWPDGIGARTIRTPWVERWAGHEDELANSFAAAGDSDHGHACDPTPAFAGPVSGMVSQREPASQIISSITDGFREFLLDGKDIDLPCADNEAMAMWVADMAFGAAPAAIDSMRERLAHPIFGYTCS